MFLYMAKSPKILGQFSKIEVLGPFHLNGKIGPNFLHFAYGQLRTLNRRKTVLDRRLFVGGAESLRTVKQC